MIQFDEAINIVLNAAFATGNEQVSFTDSAGRILAQEVLSDMDIPPFNKSSMDGFACRKSDLEAELEIVESIPAGKKPAKKLLRNQCARIMTGGVIPEDADVVFMVEDSLVLPTGKVKFTGSYVKANISIRGEDVRSGDCVLTPGRLIRPQDIAVMASVGCTSVIVRKMPKVAVISSGDELVEPDKKPALSQIRNSNAYQLLAQIKRAGAIGKYYGIAADNKEATYKIIKSAISESDLVLITGGVSMGDFDFVPSVLERAGVKILFSRVNVQPGKPTTFGVHPDALVFGLPGNPVSSFIQFELMVRPLISRMMGSEYEPSVISLPMMVNYSRKASDRLAWIPVCITKDKKVLPVDYHGSAHISAFTTAWGIISLPVGVTSVKKGEVVDVRQI